MSEQMNHSFDSLKQIDAGVLNVGYAEAGPTDGPAVVLLHGWPYDVHSYADVAPLLAEASYRAIVPHLRGYGTTRFLSGETLRNGQQSVLAIDVIALMDALGIEKAILAGFDWGARTRSRAFALYKHGRKGKKNRTDLTCDSVFELISTGSWERARVMETFSQRALRGLWRSSQRLFSV